MPFFVIYDVYTRTWDEHSIGPITYVCAYIPCFNIFIMRPNSSDKLKEHTKKEKLEIVKLNGQGISNAAIGLI